MPLKMSTYFSSAMGANTFYFLPAASACFLALAEEHPSALYWERNLEDICGLTDLHLASVA